ncbi:hypothetical protein GGS20DRAFT_448178 [Poronia punctata]|nr:hypothetical protein GGS20DRAFT_448178 [Poronia punctata]
MDSSLPLEDVSPRPIEVPTSLRIENLAPETLQLIMMNSAITELVVVEDGKYEFLRDREPITIDHVVSLRFAEANYNKWNFERIVSYFPNLRRLSWNRPYSQDGYENFSDLGTILNEYGTQLEYLELSDETERVFEVPIGSLAGMSNLKHLVTDLHLLTGYLPPPFPDWADLELDEPPYMEEPPDEDRLEGWSLEDILPFSLETLEITMWDGYFIAYYLPYENFCGKVSRLVCNPRFSQLKRIVAPKMKQVAATLQMFKLGDGRWTYCPTEKCLIRRE